MDKGNVFLLSYAFNQDYTCFICGTTAGFRVYTINPLTEVHRRELANQSTSNGCALAAMLFKTNIFPLVRCQDGRTNSNRVQIWDDNKHSMVGELTNRHEVRGIALRRDVMVMVCEYSIYMYTSDVLRLILHIATSCNIRGLCALSPKDGPWVLACPGQTTGTIRVQFGEVKDGHLVTPSNSAGNASHVFTAHQSALAALTINQTGTLIASASEQGTVVRVFKAQDGQVLHELRRGSNPCTISCLTFRQDDKYLAVASASPTVHIFRLEEPVAAPTAASGSGANNDNSNYNPKWFLPRSNLTEINEIPEYLQQLKTGISATVGTAVNQAVASVAATQNNPNQQSGDTVQEALMNAVPRYFLASRSYAQFRVPDVAPAGGMSEDPHDPLKYPDLRGLHSQIKGPLVAFGQSNNFYVFHYNGFMYDVKMLKEEDDGNLINNSDDKGVKETPSRTHLQQAHTWFASRPDFHMHKAAAGGVTDEEWELI